MRININDTTLYLDTAGCELEVDGEQLRARPTLVVLPGGPGFDHGYLRPGLVELAADAQVVFVDLRGQGRSSPAPAESCSLEQMADDVAALCRALAVERPVIFGHSAGGFVALHLALRYPTLPAGLILCHTTPTLAPLPDPHPPAGVTERAGTEAAAVAAQLFGGDFSPETGEAFARLVFPYYAAPGYEHVPGRLMALSTMNTDIAAHFFSRLTPRYDVSATDGRDRRAYSGHRRPPRLGLPTRRRARHSRRHPRRPTSRAARCRTLRLLRNAAAVPRRGARAPRPYRHATPSTGGPQSTARRVSPAAPHPAPGSRKATPSHTQNAAHLPPHQPTASRALHVVAGVSAET